MMLAKWLRNGVEVDKWVSIYRRGDGKGQGKKWIRSAKEIDKASSIDEVRRGG